MFGMKALFERSIFSVAVLLLVSSQFSQLAAQPNQSAHVTSMDGNKNQMVPAADIGRIESRNSWTGIFVVTEAGQVNLYSGRIGNVPLSEVKIGMLEKKGAFPLKRPLSEGLFFEAPGVEFDLKREADSRSPGSVMDGPVRNELAVGRHDAGIYMMNIIEYKGPTSDGK
jgi:hypothetical protein